MTKFIKIFGTILIIGVLLLCIPVAVPRFLGVGTYDVISGSMEPELSVGTLVYTIPGNAYDLHEGDIIAFRAGSSVVTHRIVSIDNANLLYTTKGDANESNDPTPVAYTNIIGEVIFAIPFLGTIASWLSITAGKICLFILVLLGCFMIIIADKMKELEDKPAKDERYGNTVEIKDSRKKNKKSVGVLLAGIIIIVAGAGYAYYYVQDYNNTNELYDSIEETYVEAMEPGEEKIDWKDMITVDFAALKTVNPDIVGWVYVEDTDISYPIMYSGEDELYLHTSFDGSTTKAGAIFLEGLNSPDFSDAHTVVYGHNMRNGSMFGSLKKYKTEDRYELSHGCFQIITPEGKNRYAIISYFDTQPGSWVYQIPIYENGMKAYIDELQKYNYSKLDVTTDSYSDASKIVTLSTCSSSDNRFTVHGLLADSTMK